MKRDEIIYDNISPSSLQYANVNSLHFNNEQINVHDSISLSALKSKEVTTESNPYQKLPYRPSDVAVNQGSGIYDTPSPFPVAVNRHPAAVPNDSPDPIYDFLPPPCPVTVYQSPNSPVPVYQSPMQQSHPETIQHETGNQPSGGIVYM